MALVTAVSAFGQKTDVFTVDGSSGVKIGGNFSGLSPTEYTGNDTGIGYGFTGTGGVSYSAWGFCFGYGSGKGCFANTDNPSNMNISTITATEGWSGGTEAYSVYVSNDTPLTYSNYSSGTKYGTLSTSLTIIGDYKYFAIVSESSSNNYFYTQLNITWTGGGSVETPAEAPTSSVEDGAKLKAGKTFTLSSTTEGAQISYKYAVADSETASIGEGDWSTPDTGASPYTVTVPKAAEGKWLHVYATATAEGYTESPAFTKAYEVEAAQVEPVQALAPTITAPAEVKVGGIFTFAPDATQTDATVSYKVAISDSETDTPSYGKATEGTSYEIPANAAGKWLYISATAGGANYTESTPETWSGKVAEEEVGPVEAGDDVFDQSTFNAAGVTISNMVTFNVSDMPGTATGLKYSGTLFGYQNSKFGVAAKEIFATTDSKNGLCVDHVTVYGPNEGWKNNVSIYVSNDPITLSNYSSATLVAKIDDNSGENWNSSSKQVDVDGDYKYVALIGGPADNTQPVLCYTKLVVSWKKVEVVEPEVGITFNNLKEQNPDANYNAVYNETDMSASTFNSVLTYVEDNVTYKLENVACGVTEGHAQWWCLNTDGGKLYNTNAVPGKHIGSIESVGAYGTMASNFTIYVGQEKLSADNVADKGTLITLSPVVPSGAPMRAAGTGSHKSWTAGEYSDYQYIYITAESLKPVASLAINWENNNIYTGVEGIEAENAEGEIYNLNGYRVSADSLVPGIYVRKANGKTVKFIVK